MTFISALAVAAEEHHGNVALETLPFGLIAAAIFAVLALVVFSYRNVANRHADTVEREESSSATSIEAGNGH